MAVKLTDREFKQFQKKHLDVTIQTELPDLADELIKAIKTIKRMEKTVHRLDMQYENLGKRLFHLEMKQRED